MKNRMALICALALTIAGAGVMGAAADSKAAEVIAAARKAIGDKKLEALKTLAVEASVQRNVNTMQMASEVEILLELPDKYVRSDVSTGPMPPMTTGFIGDKAIRPAGAMAMTGGAMVIRMGPGGPMPPAEKPSPEEQERIDKQIVRGARADISRLMLGWFAAAHPALNVEFTYAGEAASPDGRADVIDAKNADGFSARLFIDRETHLPLMLTYRGPQPRMITAGGPGGSGGAVRMPQGGDRPEMTDFTLYFDDWRDAGGGIRFPHRIRRASGGTTSEEWTIGKVKVNPKIDPKKFEG